MGDLLEQPTTMAALLDLSRLVCESLDLNEVLSRVIHAVRDLSGAELITIMLLDDSGEYLSIAASYGLDPQLIRQITFRVDEGLVGWVVQHREPLQLLDPSSDPRYKQIPINRQQVMFILPLRIHNHTLGVINLSRQSHATLFSSEVCQFVEIFASHAAIAIANAASAEALRYATTREQLSSLVIQASTSLGSSTLIYERILAKLGMDLEADLCTLVSATQMAPLAMWWAGTPGSFHWEPHLLQNQPSDVHSDLIVAVKEQGSEVAWLLVRSLRSDRYWRRAESDLLHFGANQIALVMANARLISAEQRASALSEALHQLANACNAMLEQDRVLDFVLEQLERFIKCDSSGVFLLHESQYVWLAAGRGYRFDPRQRIVLSHGPGSPLWFEAHSNQTTYIPDVSEEPDWQIFAENPHTRAWIGVPLIVNQTVIGALTIDKWVPDAFSADDVQVAQMFGDHLAVAINNAHLFREAQIRANQIHVIHQMSNRLSTLNDPQLLLDSVADLLHRTFGYYQVVLGLVDGTMLDLRSARGMVNQVSEFGEHRRYSVERGLTGQVARLGTTLLVNDVSREPGYASTPTLVDTRSELIVAIRHGSEILGIIDIESNITGSFNQHDAYLVEILAGQVAGALANIRRYEELQRTQEQLLHSERLRALGELASGLAHDFNNLLTSILGHAQLLLDITQDERVIEGLHIIEHAARDGAATVRRLQNFSHTQRSLPDEEVVLDKVVIESLAMTRPRWRDAMQSNGIRLRVIQQFGDLPPMVGDGSALREVVTNLILNALDAMPHGGDLFLRTEQIQADPPIALLEVSDTGTGMTPEVRQRAFDPFFSTKGAQGTGMGLAMAYGIVQRHHGTITIQSEPGKGTTFLIRLPIQRLVKQRQVLLPGPVAAAAQPMKILVVEDDPAVRRVIVQILRRVGHTVVDVESGSQALELLHSQQFDLLCSDLGMPEMSGWDLVARARTLHPRLITILITGWGEQISAEVAQQRGVDALVAKPVDAGRLRQLVASFQPAQQSVASFNPSITVSS
ncbi:GAF sensor hybrid histidine kinase [Oscillochloris trichoides DG-6]|uniref:histidine kinase n=1 Tax=Oscillochloris trichoides DG-6 TaxID=765420 RepID=E1IBE7_9CHLR|nr:GAF domain-containing protein [Oscillochloris trichoides]EFO81504.1 GAF sensor hybrid histidine kinase [Oscillochloris trichoides DG-6]